MVLLDAKTKQPYAIALQDGSPTAFAGQRYSLKAIGAVLL